MCRMPSTRVHHRRKFGEVSCTEYTGEGNEFELIPTVKISNCKNVKTALCLKKRPTFTTCCCFYIQSSTATIFCTNVAEKQAIKMYFIFPPHLTSASALPGETGNPEIASFHLTVACFFIKNTKHSSKYHLVRAEPPFTVKTIDWMHQTGPRKGA